MTNCSVFRKFCAHGSCTGMILTRIAASIEYTANGLRKIVNSCTPSREGKSWWLITCNGPQALTAASLCQHHSANITLPASLCHHYFASITLLTSLCQHHSASITLPASLFQHHSSSITPPAPTATTLLIVCQHSQQPLYEHSASTHSNHFTSNLTVLCQHSQQPLYKHSASTHSNHSRVLFQHCASTHSNHSASALPALCQHSQQPLCQHSSSTVPALTATTLPALSQHQPQAATESICQSFCGIL